MDQWDFFDYPLAEEKIALRPLWYGQEQDKRGQSKLLHGKITRDDLIINDRNFTEITALLKPNDLLILNDTKVLNARFKLTLPDNKKAEVLLCTTNDSSFDFKNWIALAKPLKHLLNFERLLLSTSLEAKINGRDETGRFLKLELLKTNPADLRSILEIVMEDGLTPIPPYIRRGLSDDADEVDYQTIYAEHLGSAAAPTAGLHFSAKILAELRKKGVRIEFLTLHVGPASFLPVHDPINHQPFPEMYSVSKKLWSKIAETRTNGGRVIAVGTTVIRSLESFVRLEDYSSQFDRYLKTDLFIKPGFEFKIVNNCFTNFHQPKSTHLLLIAALIGKNNLEKVYNHALKSNYRFLSYGDSSFLEVDKSS